MDIAEQSFEPEFAVVDEVVRAHDSEFASRACTLMDVTVKTELVQSIVFHFSNARIGLLLSISFFVGFGPRRGFNILIRSSDGRTLDVRDYLKLHGKSEIAASFTSDDPAKDLRRFAESAVRTLLELLDGELKPIVEGKTFEETPIDWQGYK